MEGLSARRPLRTSARKPIIEGFVGRISDLRPQRVSFNGHGFNLPVLWYSAMLHKLSASGVNCRAYVIRIAEGFRSPGLNSGLDEVAMDLTRATKVSRR